jgi:hypothetical protein
MKLYVGEKVSHRPSDHDASIPEDQVAALQNECLTPGDATTKIVAQPLCAR